MAGRMTESKKRIYGWWAFDWASQPYNTLLLTFIFAPYIAQVLGDGTRAQSLWGYSIGAAGLLIAIAAPILGKIADQTGRKLPFIWVFSAFYVIGAWGCWFAAPDGMQIWVVLILFALGLFGMECATIFTNALMPDLAPRAQMGRISGTGWALGYLGGLVAMILMLGFFSENAETGRTLFGLSPAFGLDAAAREGTRAVGPFTAIWYVIFMIPFFLWVREPHRPKPHSGPSLGQTMRQALPELARSLKSLRHHPSLLRYLLSSMFYRDALNGLYAFGGIYAAGVLGWSITDIGIFGILAIISGAVAAWIGGKWDDRFGPYQIIWWSVLCLTGLSLLIPFIGRDSLFGLALAESSNLPSLMFYLIGIGIGAAGGIVQSASRHMMLRQADPAAITEHFGLYALAGKATAFLAPFLIAVMTSLTNSQNWGVTPLIMLFLLGLWLLRGVNADPRQHE